jgi:hypothetical protein
LATGADTGHRRKGAREDDHAHPQGPSYPSPRCRDSAADLAQKPLFVAPGTTEAACAHIRTVAARLRLVNQQIKEAHQALDGLCAKLEAPRESPSGQNREQRDVMILRFWPGIGRIVLATRSGKQCFVIRRLACNKRLQNAVHHWSRVAIQHDAAARRRYDALRRRGHGHARALRSVGDRLLYALCTTLKRQTTYNPNCQTAQMSASL